MGSSAMAILRDRLAVRGFQVLTVPENATHFLGNSEGFQPKWQGAWEQVVMQRIFLDYQLAQEEAFRDFAKIHPTKRGVLLCDCCTLNGRLYLDEEQWKQVLFFPGKPTFTPQQLFDRYDLIIHLVTSAHGYNYEWGPGSNNPARYHTPEQARDIDEQCLKLFGDHPQVRVVPTFPCFEEKIQKVLTLVEDALNVDGLAGNRCRVAVHVKSHECLSSVAKLFGTSSFLVTSTFLDDQMQYSVRRRAKVPCQSWLERCERLIQINGVPASNQETPINDLVVDENAGDIMYERRTHVKSLDSSKISMTRRVITAEDYNAELALAGKVSIAGKKRAEKHVLSFIEGSLYYELFFFTNGGKQTGLLLDMAENVPIPDWLMLGEIREEEVAPSHETAPKRRMLERHSTEAAAFPT